jgi:hypothetical protein
MQTSVSPGGTDRTGSPSSAEARSWTVRRLSHSNAADREILLPLLREYFATQPATDVDARYRWLYLDNPAGPARTYAACADGRAVGVTSLFPRAIQVGARGATGAIGGDAYVIPSFRRRGIATALHRAAGVGMDTNLSFMFGPPEPANLKALLQAGAVVTGAVRRYARPLRARILGRHATRAALGRVLDGLLAPGRSNLRVEPLGPAPDPRVQTVWDATRRGMLREGEVVPVADAAFYAWRFGPSAGGRQQAVLVLDGDRPVGVGALERSGVRGAIVDVTCPRATFRRVVHALLGSLCEMDAVDIQIHVPCRTRELALLSLGFIPRQTKPFQVQLRPDEARTEPGRSLLTRPEAWKYMWGDGDLEHIL